MKKTIAAIALGMLVLSGPSLADRPHHDQAKVLAVEPIYEVVQVNHPTEQCWNEEVYHRRGPGSATSALTGAIIGGVVGNQFGRGDGNKAMTIAGALLGASVGNDLGRRGHGGYVTQERRCEIVDRYVEQEELVGYRVKYRYHGKEYWTTTDHHPGKFIPVEVDVRPLAGHGQRRHF